MFLLIAALVAVYIVLGVLYESFIHPVTILSTLPSAGIGALLALMIAGSDLDVIGIIGIVLLIGIVKKNAHHDRGLRARGRAQARQVAARRRSFEASLLRFRPILMTTLAAMLGALPHAARHRHGLGAAPAAGSRHHRRSGREPGADAVHHAGDLSVLRPAGAALRAQAGLRLAAEAAP